MAIFTFPMYGQVAQYEGKGGFMVFSDGEGEYHPEADRAAFSGGGLVCDVPGPGQILEPFNVWQPQHEEAVYAGQQASRQETFDKLCEGTYGRPPEPVVMVSAFDPMTRTWGERPEDKDEKAAREVREAGDAAIQQGHITHDELSEAEVEKLSVSEYRDWRAGKGKDR